MPYSLDTNTLHSMLSYCRETGIFTWLVRPGNLVAAGERAGCLKPSGYVDIQIKGTSFGARRLAWLYEFGNFPNCKLDHKNLCKSDNRISNLRLVSDSQNSCNTRKLLGKSSKYKGVTWHRKSKQWQASIKLYGRNCYLGLHQTEEAAHGAYLAAARDMFGEFGRAA